MTVLPDSSIWVEYLRRGKQGTAWQVDDLIRLNQILVCGPVVAELLAGAAQSERARLWHLFQAFSWAPLGRTEWRRIGELAATLREQGAPLPLTDLSIAVSAAAARAALWTRDKHFERIFMILPDLERYQTAE